MSTDATGLPSDGNVVVNRGLETMAHAVSTAGSRTVRSQDDRLTLLSVRMTYIAFSFFFACFYFAQVYLQLLNSNGLWLPAGVNHPSKFLGVGEVVLVLLAGLAYFWGQYGGLYLQKARQLQLGLWLAGALSIVAVIFHIVELHQPGFSLQGGGYVSVFIALEGTFTVVLIIATVVLLGIANRARLGLFSRSGVAVEAFGEFYGWLSAIALLNFLALYVQPFFPIAG